MHWILLANAVVVMVVVGVVVLVGVVVSVVVVVAVVVRLVVPDDVGVDVGVNEAVDEAVDVGVVVRDDVAVVVVVSDVVGDVVGVLVAVVVVDGVVVAEVDKVVVGDVVGVDRWHWANVPPTNDAIAALTIPATVLHCLGALTKPRAVHDTPIASSSVRLYALAILSTPLLMWHPLDSSTTTATWTPSTVLVAHPRSGTELVHLATRLSRTFTSCAHRETGAAK